MKISYLSFALIMILVAANIGKSTVNANSEQENRENSTEEENIKQVIRKYFDRRYHSRAVNQVEDFREFSDGTPQAVSFFKSEADKMDIEIYNAKLHHLGYAQYEYSLNFKSISFDKENQLATVSLSEGHEVIFEISEMISNTDPIISKMRDLNHTMILKKTQIGWKIISDQYEDYLWRMLRATHLSKDEVMNAIDATRDQSPTTKVGQSQSLTFSCNLPADASTHPYDRYGAIAYAHQYAIFPNPAYFYFPLPYGDCTNFVNQAIHHGSNAEEVGSGTYGWYYNDNIDHSASWTDVQFIYDFYYSI
jgi:hypothetical protein